MSSPQTSALDRRARNNSPFVILEDQFRIPTAFHFDCPHASSADEATKIEEKDLQVS